MDDGIENVLHFCYSRACCFAKNEIKRPSLGRDATTIITLITSISGLYIFDHIFLAHIKIHFFPLGSLNERLTSMLVELGSIFDSAKLGNYNG